MNNKIVIAIVVVVVVVIAAVFLFKKGPLQPGSTLLGPGGVPIQNQNLTRQTAPTNIAIPGQGATNTPQNVAVPSTVAPSNPNNNAKFRDFALAYDNNTVTPQNVVANQGDTIRLNIKAVDRDYDFTQPDFGFRVPIPKGTTKVIVFDLTAAGKFAFYCESCGGLNKGATGYIIAVAPKP